MNDRNPILLNSKHDNKQSVLVFLPIGWTANDDKDVLT